jgi:hypothetical protein
MNKGEEFKCKQSPNKVDTIILSKYNCTVKIKYLNL